MYFSYGSFVCHSLRRKCRPGEVDRDGMGVADFLLGKAGGKENYYSWDYSVDGNKIVLDPGTFGIGIPLEVSGDSLIWKGKIPASLDHLAFKRAP